MNKAGILSYKYLRFLSYAYPIRTYALYPKHYVQPIIGKQELEDFVKSKTKDEIRAMFFKAAPSGTTCSVFFDPDVKLMIQYLMRKGNRVLSRSLVENTFELIKRIQLDKYYAAQEKENVELDPRIIFRRAVENTTPLLTTKKVLRSGTFYNIPSIVLPRKAKFMAMKFLIEAANEKNKSERFVKYFAEEIIEASEKKGKAVQKKIDLHKYCEANRAYAHYRWS